MDKDMLEIVPLGKGKDEGPRIVVVGVGGGGNNSINRMVDAGYGTEVDLIAINTDAQDLQECHADAENKLQIGEKRTKTLGAGAHPEVGQEAAKENEEEIANLLKGAELVVVTCGMGGGTGTGAAPVVADISKKMGILTVGVVTKPFAMEGSKRKKNALAGIENMKNVVDTLLVIPNDKVLEIVDRRVDVDEALEKVDEVLHQCVRGISDVIRHPGKINLDFADIQTVLGNKGMAYAGIGRGSGENKCMDALQAAINSPLLETEIFGAKCVMLNFVGKTLSMLDINEAVGYVTDNLADPDSDIFWGVVKEPVADGDDDSVSITVIASGLPQKDGGAAGVQSSAWGQTAGFGQGAVAGQGAAPGQNTASRPGSTYGKQAGIPGMKTNFPTRPGQMSSMGTAGSYGQKGMRSVAPDASAQAQQAPEVQQIQSRQPQTPSQPASSSTSGGWDRDIEIPSFVKRFRK